MNPETTSLPSDLEAEYGLIGCVLADNAQMGRLGDLQTENFYSAQHRDIWQAMEILFSKGESISPFTVAPLLKRPDIFEGDALRYIGLSIASTWCVSLTFLPDHVKYLIRLSQQRDLASACMDVSSQSGELSPADAAAKLSKAAERVMNASPITEFEDNYTVTARIISSLKDNRQPDSTGIKELDFAMGGGLYPGKAYGFAARKKIGKTILAGTISHNLNLGGVKHLFICGEMSPEEVQQRVLARMTGDFPSAFRNEYGKSNPFENKLANCARTMPRNVLYKNAPGITFDELRSIYASAIDRHQIKGVILDYWQLVGGKQKHQSTAEHQDDVAQWIADYSRKRGIWTIMMAQINQDGNTRGGEGIRLAFDQVYNLKAPGDDPSRSGRYLEMMETRYTPWKNIGSDNELKIILNESGPYFEERL